jgi:hypothetical protein
MGQSGCFGLARSVARRAAVKRAPELRDKKPMLPSNQALRRSAAGQATLRVSEPGEPAEREADAMAERIVAGQPAGSVSSHAADAARLARACTECEAERDEREGLGSIAREADDTAAEAEPTESEDDEDIETMNDDSVLRRKPADGVGGASVPAGVVPREAGSALAPGVRQSMEQGFGAALGHVRVHTGTTAAESATLLRARAYTVGNHVYFGAGQYAPESRAGTRLLAHELTHVLQQTGTDQPPSLRRDEKKGAKEADKTPPAPTITRIDVDLASQEMTITYSDATKEKHEVSTGKGQKGTVGDPCQTQTEVNCTPTGTFKIGVKKGANHKNQDGDAMAWYVELTGDKVINDRGIGFHNSQTADGTPRSHGCIRVGKGEKATALAKKINQGVTADTTVVITGKAPTKAYGTPPKTKSAPKKPAGSAKKSK